MTVAEYRLTNDAFWRMLERIIAEGRAGHITGCSIHLDPTGVGRVSVMFQDAIPPGFPETESSSVETVNIRPRK